MPFIQPQMLSDTAASTNPLLAEGEMAVETDTTLCKTGDALPYGGLRAPTDLHDCNVSIGTRTSSIHATNSIGTSHHVIPSSDRRTKKNIADASSSLAIISSITLRRFDYLDPANTRHVDHGVIAQEVQEVYPHAVTIDSQIIPSILQEATATTTCMDGSVLIVLPSAHGLAENDSVSLSLKADTDGTGALLLDASGVPVFKGLTFETPVLHIISPTTFTVSPWPLYATEPDRTLMVYGKRVHDFLSVDHDVLGLIAMGGVKELMSSIGSVNAAQTHQESTLVSMASQHDSLVSSLSAANAAQAHQESTIVSMASQQQALTTAFFTLSNTISSLLGMNPSLL